MAMIMLTKNVSNRNMALTLVAWLVIPAVIMGTSLGDGLIEEATRGGAWVVVLLTAIVAGKGLVGADKLAGREVPRSREREEWRW
jgi:hypothetical protein